MPYMFKNGICLDNELSENRYFNKSKSSIQKNTVFEPETTTGNQTKTFPLHTEEKYLYIQSLLDIKIAMKDESDTSMMKGETIPVVYQVMANELLINHRFILTFASDQGIVNLTNLNAESQMVLTINATISYFTIFLKAINIGTTKVEISAINDSRNRSRISNSKNVKHLRGVEIAGSSTHLDGDHVWNDFSHSTIMVSVYTSEMVRKLSIAMGWIYFSSWVIIFYPQIYSNWKAKSVVGLNFDYLAIVLTDLSLYTVYNVGVYSSRSIQREYKDKHDTEVIPVKLNDVLFGILGVSACLVVIIQCTIYKSGNQKISRTCKMILAIILLFLVVVTGITFLTNVLEWIDLLTYMSFVKIFTVTKYVPQVYMNFQRRSTSGFSVSSIFCDFNGGLFSIGQMCADSYNFDDWSSFSGNPTKFIVGVFTLIFDIVIILQHFVCYRNAIPFEEIPSEGRGEDHNQNKSSNMTTINV